MPLIATPSPEEPDDEDRERQELRRLLSECVERTPTGSLPSEAAFGIISWLDEPIEEPDRERRYELLRSELQSSKQPNGRRWLLQLLSLSISEQQRRLGRSRRADWPSADKRLSDEDRARIHEAFSSLADLHRQAAKFDRLRYIAGASLADIENLMRQEPHAASRIADFQRAWLRYQLDRVSKESGDSDLAERPTEDQNTRSDRLERLLRENFDDMRRIVEDLCNYLETMPSQRGGLSSDDLLHEVCLRVVSDPQLDLEDRKAFFGLFSRIAAQTVVNCHRRSRQHDGKDGAPLRAGEMSRGAAPHSEGGMPRRAWRAVLRCFRAVFRRG